MTVPAAWYPQPDGQQRYWDGQAWTGNFAQGAFVPQAQGRPFSGRAIAGFILSLLWLGGLGSLVGLGLSVDAMRETRNGARAGRGLAVAGLILSILGVISVAFIYLVILQQGHDLSNQFNQMNSELSTPGVSP